MRWNTLYLLVVGSQGKFLDEIEPYLKDRDILSQLNLKGQGEILTSKDKVMLQLRDDDKCWNFVKENLQEIRQIKSWSYYRRATKASSDMVAIGGTISFSSAASELDLVAERIRELEGAKRYSLSNKIRLEELRKREKQLLKEMKAFRPKL